MKQKYRDWLAGMGLDNGWSWNLRLELVEGAVSHVGKQVCRLEPCLEVALWGKEQREAEVKETLCRERVVSLYSICDEFPTLECFVAWCAMMLSRPRCFLFLVNVSEQEDWPMKTGGGSQSEEQVQVRCSELGSNDSFLKPECATVPGKASQANGLYGHKYPGDWRNKEGWTVTSGY